jgi:hypothetical protein
VKRHMVARLGVCTTTVVLALASAASFSSPAAAVGGASGRVLTDVQIGAMAPAAQAALLDPLRAIAGALNDVGTGQDANVFTSAGIDANHDVVNLYLTDTTRAARFIQAARSANPSIDTSLIRSHRAAYTMAAMSKAAQVYLAGRHPYAVYAVSAAPDGSGLSIEVARPAAAATADGTAGAVSGGKTFAGTATPQTSRPAIVARSYRKGSPRLSKSAAWNSVKWHDSTPFIGGDVITNGSGYCTTGLPAVRISDRRPVMVTAAHCFPVGQRIYTGAGATWSWGNKLRGNYVGTVTSRNYGLDGELLVGANNNADESDVNRWIPLTSVRYSYLGDYVCQSGARSASLGHSTPCGIKVTNQDLWFLIGGHYARGVEGVDVVHGWGSFNGDSGATVWAATRNANARQARGIISSGGADGTKDQRRVDWTEAIDIFSAYRLRLNPVT